MPGLIDAPPTPTAAPAYTTKDATAVNATSQGYTPTDYSATGYDAAPYTSKDYVITPQGTVQQQVLDIVKNDSPLIQQASNQALIDMNARGLVNSSLAVGAARDAVYKTALPIATTDANAYNQAMFKSGDAANLALTNTANAQNQAAQFNTAATNLALTNTANAKNAASNFEAAAGNQASLANAQLGTNTSLANSAAANDAGKLAYGTQAQYNLAGLDAETRTQLANLNAQTQMETATLDAATRTQIANLDAATRTTLANLDADTRLQMANLDAATKTSLATLDGQYRNLLQTNQSASTAFNQVATNLANIANSNLSEEAKADATATQMNILNELLRQQAAVAGADPSGVSELNLGGYFGGGNFVVNGTGTISQTPAAAPGSQVSAFGQTMTVGSGVAPNTGADTTRYNEAKTNGYPYWIGSTGYVYPTSLAPGAWPSSSFGSVSTSPSTEGATPPPSETSPAPTTDGSNPLALGFTQTNGQWVKTEMSPVTYMGWDAVGNQVPKPIPVEQIFGVGFIGAGGVVYQDATAAANSLKGSDPRYADYGGQYGQY